MKSLRDWSVVAGPVLLALVMLSGCAQTRHVFHLQAETNAAIAWPPPPDIPRYRYLGEITGEQNFEALDSGVRTVGSRFLKWVVGLTSSKHTPTILQRPQGGVADEEGRVYVTDVSRQAVYVFDENQGTLQVWEDAGENARFQAPVGIALGAGDEILVADAELAAVVRLDKQGKPLGRLGRGQLTRPTGVARDAARGRIYIADTHAHDIKMFSDAGELLKTIGARGEGEGQFNSPTYLTFAHDQLYVTDTLNARVQVLSPEGEVRNVFGRRGVFVGDMPRPKGIAVDKDARIYVVESYFDYLLVFNADGELLLPIGGMGSGVGQFYLPAGVWTDSRGRIYVADSFNGRVVVMEFLGEGT